MIYYDFKKGLSAYECKKSLDSAFSDQAPSLAIIYGWYKEFECERNSGQHQKEAGRPPTAVTYKNIAAVKKTLMRSLGINSKLAPQLLEQSYTITCI